MKTLRQFFIFFSITFLFLFLIIRTGYSQNFWEWEGKIPLTDSVSDNTNAHLALIQYVAQPMMNMVWENSTDENSTSILYRNLLNPSEPQVVASEPGIHFTHPKTLIVAYDSSEDYFYVFYQSDQDGNQDIYYMKYGTDGQFTGPFAFATGEGDQENLTTINFGYYAIEEQDRYIVSTLAWTSNGQLMVSDLEKNGDEISFSEPVVIDSGICFNPLIASDMIYYIRENDEGRFIYYVYRQYPSYEWSDPATYFNESNCYNLSGDNVSDMYMAWSADSNDVFRNYIAWASGPYTGYRLGPESETPLDPAVCTIIIALKEQPAEFNDFYMAFPYPENGQEEIFLNQIFDYPVHEFYNFSQSGTENRNPEFYTGEVDPYNWNCFYVYLVWEEFRNDHWQIFSSRTMMCVGGIEENEDNPLSVNVFPNPFRDEVIMKYKLSSDEFVTIDVYDIYGRKIKEVFSGFQEEGEQQLNWSDETTPAGMYLIRLQTPENQASIRVVKFSLEK